MNYNTEKKIKIKIIVRLSLWFPWIYLSPILISNAFILIDEKWKWNHYSCKSFYIIFIFYLKKENIYIYIWKLAIILVVRFYYDTNLVSGLSTIPEGSHPRVSIILFCTLPVFFALLPCTGTVRVVVRDLVGNITKRQLRNVSLYSLASTMTLIRTSSSFKLKNPFKFNLT